MLEHTSRDQNLADGYQVRSVDLEDVNRRPTDGRAADQHAALIAEVVAPFVPSRMVERRDPAGGRVAAGQIRTLISIAVNTCPCKIAGHRSPAMLAGDDVLDLEGHQGVSFGEVAIFTPPAGPLPYPSMQIGIHAGVALSVAV